MERNEWKKHLPFIRHLYRPVHLPLKARRGEEFMQKFSPPHKLQPNTPIIALLRECIQAMVESK